MYQLIYKKPINGVIVNIHRFDYLGKTYKKTHISAWCLPRVYFREINFILIAFSKSFLVKSIHLIYDLSFEGISTITTNRRRLCILIVYKIYYICAVTNQCRQLLFINWQSFSPTPQVILSKRIILLLLAVSSILAIILKRFEEYLCLKLLPIMFAPKQSFWTDEENLCI